MTESIDTIHTRMTRHLNQYLKALRFNPVFMRSSHNELKYPPPLHRDMDLRAFMVPCSQTRSLLAEKHVNIQFFSLEHVRVVR
jgi:hypothetical protein